MKKIQKYSLLKCVHDIDIINTKSYNHSTAEDVEFLVRFEKGKTYICLSSKHATVTISMFVDCIQNSNEIEENNNRYSYDEESEAVFVYDSELYDAPDVYKHFKLIEECPSETIYTGNKSGYWQDNGRYRDNTWNTSSKRTINENFTIVLNGSEYDHKIIWALDNKIPTVGAEVGIKAYQTQNIKFTDKVLKLKLELGNAKYYKYDLSKFKLNKNLQYLNIGIADPTPKKNNIDNLVIPKKLRVLEMDYCKMSKLPNVKNAVVGLHNCHINSLSLKNIVDIKHLQNCTYGTYDNESFSFEWEIENPSRDGGRFTSKTIFKVEEDKFAITDGKRFITKSELATFCATYGLKGAMDFFNLDKKTQYKFMTNGWSNREGDDCIDFIQDDETNEITLMYKNGILQIADMISFPWFNPRTNITIVNGEIEINQNNIYESDGETVNDTLLSLVMKLSEDERFPDGYFDKFIKACNNTTSKFIGDINISDFKFDMFKTKINQDKLQNLRFNASKQQWTYSYDTDDHGSSRRNTVNWGKQAFKLENIKTKHSKVFLNPNCNTYYNNLRGCGIDHMHMLRDPNHQPLFDESISYIYNVGDRQFEESGFMLLDSKMYKHHNYQLKMYGNIQSDFYKGGHYENVSHENIKKISPSISIAERLAKKYKFKLSLDAIRDEKYMKIERIYENLYNNGDNHYIPTALKCAYSSIDKLLIHENPLINKNNGFEKVLSPIIKIGDKIYIYWNSTITEIFKEDGGEISTMITDHRSNKSTTKTLYDLLSKNQYTFSYINLPVDDKVTEPLRKYILDNHIYFSQKMVSSAMLNDNEYLYRIAFYEQTRYCIKGSDSYNGDSKKWDSIADKTINVAIAKFGPIIRKHFDKALIKSQSIETKSNKLINIVKNIKARR